MLKDSKKSKFALGEEEFDVAAPKPIVDKSLFIKAWFECEAAVPVILRPCKFGKSFNLSMLQSFFSIDSTFSFETFSSTKKAPLFKHTRQNILNKGLGAIWRPP